MSLAGNIVSAVRRGLFRNHFLLSLVLVLGRVREVMADGGSFPGMAGLGMTIVRRIRF